MFSNLLSSLPAECTTRDVAKALGLAVRSVQLMVNRGELDAWKTPGGHRRISRESVERWLASRGAAKVTIREPLASIRRNDEFLASGAVFPRLPSNEGEALGEQRQSVLLIEDSVHFQTLVRLLLAHSFPDIDLHVADDGIVGLAMVGQIVPSVIIVDILLPGMDGATLVGRLRTHPKFERSKLVILTSLDESQLEPYAFALAGLPVVHKPNLARDLPALISRALEKARRS